MGIVYYSRYLEYFEVGRSALLKTTLLTYSELEEKYQVYLPVIEAHARYVAPARYEDEITLYTIMKPPLSKKLCFEYRIQRGELLLAEGYTNHLFINRQTGKPVSAPKAFMECIANALRSQRVP